MNKNNRSNKRNFNATAFKFSLSPEKRMVPPKTSRVPNQCISVKGF
jgi:hypothetical protein